MPVRMVDCPFSKRRSLGVQPPVVRLEDKLGRLLLDQPLGPLLPRLVQVWHLRGAEGVSGSESESESESVRECETLERESVRE